jgi:hypothetical protein
LLTPVILLVILETAALAMRGVCSYRSPAGSFSGFKKIVRNRAQNVIIREFQPRGVRIEAYTVDETLVVRDCSSERIKQWTENNRSAMAARSTLHGCVTSMEPAVESLPWSGPQIQQLPKDGHSYA